MWKNYWTVAWRQLSRHSLFAAIHISCLTIGITCSLLIGVYVIREKNVNADVRDLDNQYVLKSRWKQEAMGNEDLTLGPLAKTLYENYPGLVANYFRSSDMDEQLTVGTRSFKEHVVVCDTSLLTMFGFPLLQGNPSTAFDSHDAAVVTEDFAIKYFGKTDVLGQVIQAKTPWGAPHAMVISAVLKNMPRNTPANFSSQKTAPGIFIPFAFDPSYNNYINQQWVGQPVHSMIELKTGVRPADLQRPLADILQHHAGSMQVVVKGNLRMELTALKDFHLLANQGTVAKTIRALSLMAAFILLLAIVNFVNIKIGTSVYRLRETGLRKIFGGDRQQIILQHLCESFLVTAGATLASICLYAWLRPFFGELLNTELTPVGAFGRTEILYLIVLVLVVGCLSGGYPAFVLSSTRIIQAVKGKVGQSKGGWMLSRGLLVVQFSIAIIVFIAALQISRQTAYFLKKDLGYRNEGLLVLSSLPLVVDTARSLPKIETFRDELPAIPGVLNGTVSGNIPNGEYSDNLNLVPDGSTTGDFISMPYLTTDEHFADVYGLTLREGRFLEPAPPGAAPREIVLNEQAVKAFGWTHPIGRKVKLAVAGIWVTVVGVVKDFNFSSLHKKIEPVAFINVRVFGNYQYLSVRVKGGDIAGTLASLRSRYKTFFPTSTFDCSFMDDKLMALYQSEQQLKKAADLATVMSFVIVFLGIFGVVAYTLTLRTKEVAIRKVLGAGMRGIVLLFVKDYVWLILAANIIAWPLAYILTDRWLQNYAYRIHQNGLLYALVGVLIGAVISLLVAVQSYTTAAANPVRHLRAE